MVNRWTYRWRHPRPGEVVVFNTSHSDDPLISRVVGIEGDEVALKNYVLIVNGVRITDERSRPIKLHEYSSGWLRHESLEGSDYDVLLNGLDPTDESIVVPSAHVYVFGDYRDNAKDSRIIGSIHYNDLIGHAYFRRSGIHTSKL